jgi:CelD/BcsL family acetyltransferase involved in cellulose biosynthesis
MRLHDDWSTAALDRQPAATCVGPFPRRGFLEVWWRQRGSGSLLLAETDAVLLPLWEGPGGVEIVGEADLTDYHCPLGGGPDDTAEFGEALAGTLPSGTRFRLDSLPGEVALPLSVGLAAGGVEAPPVQHEAAAVLELSPDYDRYLAGLRSKDRHEIRRKQRRFEAAIGQARLVRDGGPDALGAFLWMHRAAGDRKGGFMTPGMEEFFSGLLGIEGAVLSLLTGEDGKPVAGAFGFEDEYAYYLYNSAYDPGSAAESPGVILIDRLIAGAIAGGKHRLDFLKGDEAYKFRMGAVPRPLFILEGTT